MNCLKIAFEQAGIRLELPPWFQIDNMQTLCDSLGLEWHTGKELSLEVEPVIVIYRTRPGKAHAVYTEDVGLYLSYPITGIVRLHKGQEGAK